MKSILLHIHDDIGECARLDAALALTPALEARLHCVQPLTAPRSLEPVLMPPSIQARKYEERVDDALAEASAPRARCEARLNAQRVDHDWHQAVADPSALIEQRARVADLCILSLDTGSAGAFSPLSLVAGLTIRMRTPILAVPASRENFAPTAPVVVAWNGSTPAAAALRASVPLLRLSERVIVTAVDDGRVLDLPASDAIDYLSCHGVSAQLDEPTNVRDVGEALLASAVANRAWCIVMGAYGHARVKELMLGGVTRSLLSNDVVPLFLAH